MALLGAGAENVGMNTVDRLHSPGAELLAAAQDFRAAAEQPGSHELAPRPVRRSDAFGRFDGHARAGDTTRSQKAVPG
jgi:hypothetical protein